MTAVTGGNAGSGSTQGHLHFAIDGGVFTVPNILQPKTSSVHFHRTGDGSAGLWATEVSLNITLELINAGVGISEPAVARLQLVQPNGKIHADGSATVPPVSAAKSVTISTVITVKHAELWSIPRPFIYTLVAHLERHDPGDPSTVRSLLDSVNTTVGLRTAVFKENDGLHLNGQRVRLKGFCNHNDFDAGTLY